MSEIVQQQVIISGVGGQGVLFVTRLLAEAAINKGLPVFTSETHGMAQRGGTVLSHFKVGDFSSPLIRPKRADILVLLKSENLKQHGSFLRPGGWAVSNGTDGPGTDFPSPVKTIDADTLAQEIENPKGFSPVPGVSRIPHFDRIYQFHIEKITFNSIFRHSSIPIFQIGRSP